MTHYLADFHLRAPDGTAVILRMAEPPGFRVMPEDDPQRPYYAPRAERLANFEVGLFSGAAVGGRSRVGRADAVLRNADHALDGYDQHAWNRAVIWALPDGPFIRWANAVRVFSGPIARADWDGDEVVVKFRDAQAACDRALTRAKHLGNNARPRGVEGFADIKDREKPCAFGRVFAAPGRLVNEVLQIYQWHDGRCAVLNPKVGGKAVPSQGDVGSAIDDPALVIDGGYCKTDLSRGLARLGFVPTMPVTADVDGDAPGGVWPSAPGDLLRHIATTRLLVSATAVDEASVALLRAAWPEPCGVFLADGAGGLETLDTIASSAAAWWTLDFAERFGVGSILPPAGPYDLILTDAARIVRLDRQSSADPLGGDAYWRVEINHSENLTPLTDQQVAPTIPDAQRPALLARWPAPAVAENPAVLAANPALADRADGGVLKLDSRWASAAPAQRLANLLLSLRAPSRRTVIATLDAARARLVRPGSGVLLRRSELAGGADVATRLVHLTTDDGVTYRATLRS
ncbi:hypothetical protein ACIU1J_32335 [Azospirillum doebereinerae]|uniref:hypothetical protein n=1 Tax=Azospirillum doebereinerae TaxID=92933 RepID=UPI001EE4ECB9|nr:hypothetical protein [Azospirillum doebereinerae]MCG5238369.1 hypothetical protein [Azospirillum doebereinerae]